MFTFDNFFVHNYGYYQTGGFENLSRFFSCVFRILDLEENQARVTDLNHNLYSHLQVEEPGGGASKEGGEDLGHGHGAEGSGTGD